GFTVSLFIADLAFTDVVLRDEAKIGIFAASAVAGVAGFVVLRSRWAAGRHTAETAGPLSPGSLD
ncbi:MAG: Na+/H+ antiporter NhaA, partial [Actinobacteria bacterium]